MEQADDQGPLGKVKGISLSGLYMLLVCISQGRYRIELELILLFPKLFLESSNVSPPEVANLAFRMECSSCRVK